MNQQSCSAQKGYQVLLGVTVPLSSLRLWDFPGGPVVKTPPSNAGGTGSVPCQGAKIPHASWAKTKTLNKSNKFNKDFFSKAILDLMEIKK